MLTINVVFSYNWDKRHTRPSNYNDPDLWAYTTEVGIGVIDELGNKYEFTEVEDIKCSPIGVNTQS